MIFVLLLMSVIFFHSDVKAEDESQIRDFFCYVYSFNDNSLEKKEYPIIFEDAKNLEYFNNKNEVGFNIVMNDFNSQNFYQKTNIEDKKIYLIPEERKGEYMRFCVVYSEEFDESFKKLTGCKDNPIRVSYRFLYKRFFTDVVKAQDLYNINYTVSFFRQCEK